MQPVSSSLSPTKHQSRLVATSTAVFVALLLLLPFSLSAQTVTAGAGARTFTFEECLKIASGDNFDVQNAMAQLNSAESSVKAAFGQYLPGATMSLGYGRQLNTTSVSSIGGARVEFPISNPNSFSANANLNYMIFDGFNREGTYSQAQLNRDAADMSLAQARRKVLSTVRSQYLSILRAKQVVKTRKEDFEVGKKQLERVRAQYEAGVVAIAPVYTQEADVSNRELAIVQAENDLEVAKGTLLATLGLNPTLPADFADVKIPETVGDDDMAQFRATVGAVNMALNQALQKRLDVSSARISSDAAAAGVRAQNGRWFPSLFASFGYSWFGNDVGAFNDGSSQSFGLTMRYTLFDGFNRDNQIQQAQVQLIQSEIKKRQVEQAVSGDVQNAYIQLAAAEKNLDITARSLKSAEQNFNAAEERFKVGAANILDYTTANGTLVTARINRINTLYNYVAAQYQMRFALGTLDEDLK